MKSIRSIVRPVAIALVLAVSAAPLTAFAGDRAPVADVKKEKRFPMTAESFNKLVEKRLSHARERLTQMLATRKVPEAKQAQIKKDFEDGAAAVKAAAARAGADGNVTKEEAKSVRDIAKDLKRKGREKHMPGKGPERRKGHDKKNDNVG